MGWPKGKPRKLFGGAETSAENSSVRSGQNETSNEIGRQTQAEDPLVLDPELGAPSSDSEGAPSQARDRPKRKRKGEINVKGLEALLYSVHLGLSHFLKIPELQIEQEEAANLADAAAKVGRHYNLPEFSEKMLDWTNLLMVLGTVYGTRMSAAAMRKAAGPAAGPMAPKPVGLQNMMKAA